ncbi:hypothetical protein [Mycoplasma wenyonii]|uniref:hypothetical protein n=1 Tax=Mycoplasma wenyonii TaxID=65123 RepID=UPI000310E733|nr:hypothetical protein [Mycoplasma wenyonii]
MLPGGGEDKGKKLNLDFTWGNSSSFETKPFVFNTPIFDFELGESQAKNLYLMNLCKEVEDGVFSDIPGSKKILKCVWEGKGEELWEDYWVEAEESKISPPPSAG